MLIDLAGRAVNKAVLPFMAEPVRLHREFESAGGLDFLRIDPATLARAAA